MVDTNTANGATYGMNDSSPRNPPRMDQPVRPKGRSHSGRDAEGGIASGVGRKYPTTGPVIGAAVGAGSVSGAWDRGHRAANRSERTPTSSAMSTIPRIIPAIAIPFPSSLPFCFISRIALFA